MMKNRFLFLTVIFTTLFLIISNTEVTGRDKLKKGKEEIPYKEIKKIDIDSTVLSESQKICMKLVSAIDEAAIDTTRPKPVPKYWKTGILTNISISQVSLTNWAGGGNPNISANGLVDANANYSKDKMIFENRLKLSYGFIQSFDNNTPLKQQFKKSDDRLLLDSKWGYMLYNRLYFSALLNFRTQFTPTHDNSQDPPVLKSTFLAPGYLSLGLGINYKPFQFLSLNLSPLTGNFVFVTKENLREIYGNRPDQACRMELGAQFKMDLRYSHKFFKIGTYLTLFSDYLNNPKNIQVYWDVDLALYLGKHFTLSLRTNLIYDDNIKIPDKKGENPVPRVQFQEILGFGFSYTFGNYVKPS